MKQLSKKILIRTMKTLIYGVVGAFLMGLGTGIFMLNRKADLEIWHTTELDEEFTTSSKVSSFEDYLALEERLFTQLDETVYQTIDTDPEQSINRFHRNSLSDPNRWPSNWNRSYELPVPAAAGGPKAGILLLHGLSDSPYSLRSLGQHLHSKGAHVLGLRIPGHGTAPVGLTQTTWQDMAAAVTIAMRRVSEMAEGKPLYIVGYSNGGALAVHYALSSLEDSSLPSLDGLALISPEIGVTSMAALAIWQERIGKVLGLKKLGWTDIGPEYEPFKYTSFPVNAGNLAYELTGENRARITRLKAAKKLGDFPPVLAFQSVVDATVSAPDLVDNFFSMLPEGDHELVVFGLNRLAKIDPLLKDDPRTNLPALIEDADRHFTFSVLTNHTLNAEKTSVRSWAPGQVSQSVDSETGLNWPKKIYSLSHVALPFSGKDPVYGGDDPEPSPGIYLGDLALRGEKDALRIPASNMLRLRWNPFYPYMEQRVTEHLGLAPVPATSKPKDQP